MVKGSALVTLVKNRTSGQIVWAIVLTFSVLVVLAVATMLDVRSRRATRVQKIQQGTRESIITQNTALQKVLSLMLSLHIFKGVAHLGRYHSIQ